MQPVGVVISQERRIEQPGKLKKVMRKAVGVGILVGWVSLAALAWAEQAAPGPAQVLLTPAPKQIRWTSEKLHLGESPVIELAAPELVQVGRLLAAEMERLYRLRPQVVVIDRQAGVGPSNPAQQNPIAQSPEPQNPPKAAGQQPLVQAKTPQGRIELLLSESAEGKARLAALGDWLRWPPPRNRQEGYVLCVEAQRAWLSAETPRGCLYGCQTLLQLIHPKEQAGAGGPPSGSSDVVPSLAAGSPAATASKQAAKASLAPSQTAQTSLAPAGAWLPGVWIADWPQLPFRGVHLCIFPNTELPAIRQAILWAARFKCNAVVIEPWASLRSRRRPETAYPHAYSPEEVRPLVLLGRALQMDMIPMLNSWGHATGMRSRSGEHVVLDRFPEFRELYEADGWSFRLANPAIYEHLFDRYEELLELFGPVRYFHVGMDEAWGHLGTGKLNLPPGKEPHQLAAEHLLKLHRYFADRKIRILMWHDMLVRRGDPELGGAGPAGSIPPYNTHLALEKLPRDIIIAAWNYDVAAAWPIPKYFRDKGFPVVVCPWKSRRNTVFLVNQAKELDLLGVLATTWDSLDVSLPSVAQAAVLAWEEPKSDLLRIPFDHWLAEIRKLPICNLPQLETTLQPTSPENAPANQN